jgi:hypothetical protein
LARLHELIAEHPTDDDVDPDGFVAQNVFGIETDPGTWVSALVASGYPRHATTLRSEEPVNAASADPRAWLCVLNDGLFGDWAQLSSDVEIVSLPEAMEPLVEYCRSISGSIRTGGPGFGLGAAFRTIRRGRRIETRSLSGTSKSVTPADRESSPSARCTAATWSHHASIASGAAALAVSLCAPALASRKP